MTVGCLQSFPGVLNYVFYWQVHYSTCFDTKTVQSVCNLECSLLYEGKKHWLVELFTKKYPVVVMQN